MKVTQVLTDAAPAPVGPYSQAVIQGRVAYCSGQIPIDPTSGELVGGDIEQQTRQVLRHLKAVVDAAGSSLEQVLRTTVYIRDLALFPRVNAVYREFFRGTPPPARSTVQVAGLPMGAQIEIDAIAAIDE